MRRIKIFVLLCVLVLTCANGARADDVVSADNKGFASLQDAIDAAKGSGDITIKLSADIINLTTTVVISRDKNENLTIDLNGKTISGDKVRALWIKSGDVTIKGGGTISAKGDNGKNSSSVIRVGSDNQIAKLTIEKGVTISSDNCYGITLFANGDQAVYGQELIFNGTVAVTGTASAISGNGSSSYSATRIVISPDAIITASSDIGIYHPQSGEIIFYGGKISGPSALEMKGGSAIIYSGDFTAMSSDLRNTGNNDGPSTQGYALAAVINNAYKGSADITIFGGTFKGAVSKVSDDKSYEKYDPTVIAVGGSFDQKISDDYVLPGYVVISVDVDNCYTVKRDAVISADSRLIACAKEGESLDKVVINSIDVKVYAVKAYSDDTKTSYTESVDVPGTWSWVSGDSQVVTFADGDNTTFEILFTPDSLDVKKISASIKISVDISHDSIQVVSINDGLLSYDIKPDSSADLADILKYVKKSQDIKFIQINDQISAVSADSLKGLANLKSLDLTQATGLTNTSLDFSGNISIDYLILSGNERITELRLDSSSNIISIDAHDTRSLDTVIVSPNSNLKELNLRNANLTSIDLTGCDALVSLDVSQNHLLILDVPPSVISGDWSSQSNDKAFIVKASFDLTAIILSGDTFPYAISSKDLAKSIDSVFEISGDSEIIQGAYSQDTGIASFDHAPTGYIRYGYIVKSGGKSMDVTLTGNKSEQDEPEQPEPQDTYKFKTAPTIDDNGGLSYDVKDGESVTLKEIVDSLDQTSLDQVLTLEINDKVTSIDNESLKSLKGLVSLDLSNASSLDATLAIDLDGKSLDTLRLSENTSVTTLIISTDISFIDAVDSKLQSLTISEDANIDIIDVRDCASLDTLIAKKVGAKLVLVDGCDSLKTLDVSENKLLFLDLSDVSDTLVNPAYKTQINESKFKTSRDFDINTFIKISSDLGTVYIDFNDYSSDALYTAESIDGVIEISSQDASVTRQTPDSYTSGIASFENTPIGYLKYYYYVSGDKTNSMDVTLTGNESEPAPDPEDPNPDDDNNKDPSEDVTPPEKITKVTVTDGEISYEVSGDAALDEVLCKLGIAKLSTIKTLKINSQITMLTGLTTLSNLQVLDLTQATNLTDETLDLNGINSNFTTLTLSSNTSKVSHINAGGTSLSNITLDGNKNIETLNFNNSKITTLDVSNCTNLKSLSAKNTGLTSINLSGCSNLESLDVSDNKLKSIDVKICTNLISLDVSRNNLLILDLQGLIKLNSGDWSGQTNDVAFAVVSKDFDLAFFIKTSNDINVEDTDFVNRIFSVNALSGDSIVVAEQAKYSQGIAKFEKTPINHLRYYYEVFVANTDAPSTGLDTTMDVTLTNNKSVADPVSENPPSGGNNDNNDPSEEEQITVGVTSGGRLGYTIPVNQVVPLSEILAKLRPSDIANIRTLPVSYQINEIDIDLTELTKLTTLDLTSAFSLSDATIELEDNQSIRNLTLSRWSGVSSIKASGSTLRNITLASNDVITELDISNSNVSTLDASDCYNLEEIHANETGLTSINLTGCTKLKTLEVSKNKLESIDLKDCQALEEIDVSENHLLALDLSGLTKLDEDECNWGLQSSDKTFVTSKDCNIVAIILSLDVSGLRSRDIIGRIGDIAEISIGDDAEETIIQTANYNSDTGIATFDETPTGTLRYYYRLSNATSNPVRVSTLNANSSMDVTLTGNKSVAEIKTDYVKGASVDLDGGLSYDIDGMATLEEVLSDPSVDVSAIERLPINSQITSVTNADLKRLTNLKSLDLSGASGLENTELDLSGLTIDTVILSDGTSSSLETLRLSTDSNIAHIEASRAPIKNIIIRENDYIETLNIDYCANVASLDAKGCENLQELNARGCRALDALDVSDCEKLESLIADEGGIQKINLKGCSSLRTLNIASNRLLYLDVSDLTNLDEDECNWSGQGIFVSSLQTQFDLAKFIFDRVHDLITDVSGDEIMANIGSVVEISGDTPFNYDAKTGIITFDRIPSSLKYYYYVDKAARAKSEDSESGDESDEDGDSDDEDDEDDSNEVEESSFAVVAAKTDSMDVTLTIGDTSEVSLDKIPLGASGAGCNAIGSGSVFLLLSMFALAFSERRRG